MEKSTMDQVVLLFRNNNNTNRQRDMALEVQAVDHIKKAIKNAEHVHKAQVKHK